MDAITFAQAGSFFDNGTTGQLAPITEYHILFNNAEGTNLHVVSEYGTAINDGGRMDIQRTISKVFPMRRFTIFGLQESTLSVIRESIDLCANHNSDECVDFQKNA